MPSSHIRNSSSAQEEEEPLFFQAMRIGVTNSIIWEEEDLENLLAAVPTKSIGQQAVSKPNGTWSDGGIPRPFRENGVRIVDWNFWNQMSEEDLVHLQQHGGEVQGLEVSVHTVEEVRTIECIPDLRDLCIRGQWEHRALAYLPQPSLTKLSLHCMSLSVCNPFASIKELYIQDSNVQDLELGHCVALQKLCIVWCDVTGISNIVLPDSVREFRLIDIHRITNVIGGRACHDIYIHGCPDLHTVNMQAVTTFGDGGQLVLRALPSLAAVSMRQHALQPSPSIATKAHRDGITYRENTAWE